MKVIITNDDGIDAPGINLLNQVCESLGFQTVVAAPAIEHSYAGHRLTVGTSIPVDEIKPNWFSIQAAPADCVRLAVRCLAPDADWIFSGINHGANLGADIYSSGTVAAAREATLLGYKAISLSHFKGKGRMIDWKEVAPLAEKTLSQLLKQNLKPHFFWNVNFSHLLTGEKAPETVFCPIDPSPLHVQFKKEEKGYIYSGDYHSRDRLPNHDVAECLGGKITISAISLHYANMDD